MSNVADVPIILGIAASSADTDEQRRQMDTSAPLADTESVAHGIDLLHRGSHPSSNHSDTTNDILDKQDYKKATETQLEEPTTEKPGETKDGVPVPKKSFAFWMIIVSLCCIIFVASMDATIVVTAFPTVVHEIGGEAQYVWISNSFVLASICIQPLTAQLSNIFGRRNPLLIVVALFALGSGLAGGASNVAMLIVGRTVQGLGGGGIYVLADLVICDIVSLRDRGKYLSSVMSFAGIGVTVGPIIGGALAQSNWRWVFYINLPPCGLSFLVMFFFLKLKHKRSPTWKHALARVDIFGSALFITSICSILLGLVMGGTVHPWSSWRIIVPLVLGVVGWAAFHVYEASPFCEEPSIPPRIFGNRTTFASLIMALVAAMLLEWGTFFLPVYFMGAHGTSPLTAGVDVLPYTILTIPFSIISGIWMTKTGRYRPIHGLGFALLAISFGLFSILSSSSPKVAWACYEVLNAAGTGLVLMSALPSALAPLPESDVGTATGTYAFLRGFGMVWGVTLPSIIFNGQFNKFLHEIDSPSIRSLLVDGGAYAYASNGFVASLGSIDRSQVVHVYAKALKTVWQVAAAFAVFGFMCVFVEKHVELRQELNTDYGLEEKPKDESIKIEEGKDIVV